MEPFPTYFAIFSMKQKTFKRRTRPDMIECDRKRVVVFLVITTVDNFDEKQEMPTIAAKVANRCQLFQTQSFKWVEEVDKFSLSFKAEPKLLI